MWLHKELSWGLSKVCDLLCDRLTHGRIRDVGDVDGTLVREVAEHVHGLASVRTRLLVAKDEVDPVVQMHGDIL